MSDSRTKQIFDDQRNNTNRITDLNYAGQKPLKQAIVISRAKYGINGSIVTIVDKTTGAQYPNAIIQTGVANIGDIVTYTYNKSNELIIVNTGSSTGTGTGLNWLSVNGSF